ncbi:MAG: hypothetical protein PVI41_02195 [Roseobacter sp.]|jgi:predicted  nucleic acid-binding Zn-ribbon protein
MGDIEELSGRIMAALDRVAQGVDALQQSDASEVEALGRALEEEKQVNAELSDRVQALEQRQEQAIAALEAKAAEAAGRVSTLDRELQQLRTANDTLIDACNALREANAEGVGDAELINQSLQAELKALQAARSAEAAEAHEIISALTPLLRASAAQQNTEEAH